MKRPRLIYSVDVPRPLLISKEFAPVLCRASFHNSPAVLETVDTLHWCVCCCSMDAVLVYVFVRLKYDDRKQNKIDDIRS